MFAPARGGIGACARMVNERVRLGVYSFDPLPPEPQPGSHFDRFSLCSAGDIVRGQGVVFVA
jgi:hypothetical protein